MTNKQNINNLAQFQKILQPKYKILECILSGRIGNIILEIFSTFYFLFKFQLLNDFNLVINSNYDFINLKNELITTNYLQKVFPFFLNFKNIFKTQAQYKYIDAERYKAKAYGLWLGVSFNAQLVGSKLEDKFSNINDIKKFSYIETNFFEAAYNNIDFYKKNIDAANLFYLLFYNKELFDSITITNDSFIAYCIRLGDFKTLMPNCLIDINIIKSEIASIQKQYKNKKIIIFSDEIEKCKQFLNTNKNLLYHKNINDYIDLILISKCYLVYGNKFSTFVQVSKILNYLQYEFNK